MLIGRVYGDEIVTLDDETIAFIAAADQDQLENDIEF